MQTIEEYKAYTRQLEGEVGKWHNAYDALIIERNALVRKILETEKSVSVRNHENGYDCVMLTKEAFEAMSNELEELRKHEVEWDMAKARIKELLKDYLTKRNDKNANPVQGCKRNFE